MLAVPDHYRPFVRYALVSIVVVLVLGFHKDSSGGTTWHLAWHEGLIAIATAAAVAFIDRAFMFRHVLGNIARTVEAGLDKALPLAKQASGFGLTRIHPGSENAARESVLEAVRRAKDQVYVLAIAGHRPVDVVEIIGAMRDQRSRARSVANCKILLSNPFRGGAIFRSFLSANSAELGQLVEEAQRAHEEGASLDINSEIRRRTIPMYASALRARLDSDFAQFQQCVRYYASDCQLWLVIADEVLFVKDMTFSRASDDVGEANRSHSSHTPLLEYRGTAAKNLIHAYARHVDELWRSATDDWDWIQARYEQNDALYRKFFRDRWPWLRHAFKGAPRQYRHKFIRDLDWPEIKLRLGDSPEVAGTIVDASPGGLGITVGINPDGWRKDALLTLIDFGCHRDFSESQREQKHSTDNARLLRQTCKRLGIARFRIVEDPKSIAGGFHVSLQSIRG